VSEYSTHVHDRCHKKIIDLSQVTRPRSQCLLFARTDH